MHRPVAATGLARRISSPRGVRALRSCSMHPTFLASIHHPTKKKGRDVGNVAAMVRSPTTHYFFGAGIGLVSLVLTVDFWSCFSSTWVDMPLMSMSSSPASFIVISDDSMRPFSLSKMAQPVPSVLASLALLIVNGRLLLVGRRLVFELGVDLNLGGRLVVAFDGVGVFRVVEPMPPRSRLKDLVPGASPCLTGMVGKAPQVGSAICLRAASLRMLLSSGCNWVLVLPSLSINSVAPSTLVTVHRLVVDRELQFGLGQGLEEVGHRVGRRVLFGRIVGDVVAADIDVHFHADDLLRDDPVVALGLCGGPFDVEGLLLFLLDLLTHHLHDLGRVRGQLLIELAVFLGRRPSTPIFQVAVLCSAGRDLFGFCP